jgi:hypothetical protein
LTPAGVELKAERRKPSGEKHRDIEDIPSLTGVLVHFRLTRIQRHLGQALASHPVPGTDLGTLFASIDLASHPVPGTNGTVRPGSERKFSSGTWKIFVILPRALAIDDDFKNLPWLKSRTFLASAN